MAYHYTQDVTADIVNALVEDLQGKPAGDLLSNKTKLSSCLQSLAQNDITASLIDKSEQARAHIISKEDTPSGIVLCGSAWVEAAFVLLDPSIQLTWYYKDGDRVPANTTIVEIKGSARVILTAERTALNFLQTLSATATTTAYYVSYLSNSHTQLLDTRKTIPGMRQAQKYAVRCGGGNNHRMGLYDAFLIKENHIRACGSIKQAIANAKTMTKNKLIEIEVESIDELEQAIEAKADVVMLDNFSTEQIQRAVSLNNQRCKLEVSGNITEQRLAELAKTGVDFVSTGAITKHVKAVDLSLLIL